MKTTNRKTEHQEDSFRLLVRDVTAAIARNKDNTSQQQQVEELFAAEIAFREVISTYKQSTEVYKRFLQKIKVTNHNILSAMPYFRIRGKMFATHISPLIKANDADSLKKFDINFQLVKFIRDNWVGPFPRKAQIQYDRVYNARRILVENNAPLCINRALLFYRKTPKSHLTLMDLIGIASTGLTSGIDKFVGKYSHLFRGVIVGRIVGNLISEYSETSLHFFPNERRILYNAYSIRGKKGIEDPEELIKIINARFDLDRSQGKSAPKGAVTASQLSNLMKAASLVSADSTLSEEGLGVYDYTMSDDLGPEEYLTEREEAVTMIQMATKLSVLERKVLRLKGVRL